MSIGIKAVVFDLGQVLIHLDFSEVMLALGLPAHQPISEWLKNMDAWDAYDKFERGHVSETDFFRPNPQLKQVWNTVLKNAIPEANHLLGRVKKSARLFALTNSNATHLRHAAATYPFFAQFERVFSSHDIGARKPEAEIYKFVEREIKFSGKEILFIDDRIENVEGAKALGWNAELCKQSPDDLVKILNTHKLL